MSLAVLLVLPHASLAQGLSRGGLSADLAFGAALPAGPSGLVASALRGSALVFGVNYVLAPAAALRLSLDRIAFGAPPSPPVDSIGPSCRDVSTPACLPGPSAAASAVPAVASAVSAVSGPARTATAVFLETRFSEVSRARGQLETGVGVLQYERTTASFATKVGFGFGVRLVRHVEGFAMGEYTCAFRAFVTTAAGILPGRSNPAPQSGLSTRKEAMTYGSFRAGVRVF